MCFLFNPEVLARDTKICRRFGGIFLQEYLLSAL